MYTFFFTTTLFVLFAVVIVLDKKYEMLRDLSTASPKPYSFSRVQLAWWTVLVLAAIVTIILTKGWQIPDLTNSTLYLLGISSATTTSAALIDLSDKQNQSLTDLNQNISGNNFFLDILSDKKGVSIHRFQTVMFNIVFGLWYIKSVNQNLNQANIAVNDIIPVFSNNNLILLGLSAGLYAALKSMENKN
jgi:hypothetical protein